MTEQRAVQNGPGRGPRHSSGAEGVAVDAQGNVYGAEVGSKNLKKYALK